MTQFRSLLLASVVAVSALPSGLMAQDKGIVPQPAEGWKEPPPAEQQPGPVTGSAANSPAVSGQADGQPVVTPPQGAGPSQAQLTPNEPPKPNATMAPPSSVPIQGTAAPNNATMPESPALKTPEPSRY